MEIKKSEEQIIQIFHGKTHPHIPQPFVSLIGKYILRGNMSVCDRVQKDYDIFTFTLCQFASFRGLKIVDNGVGFPLEQLYLYSNHRIQQEIMISFAVQFNCFFFVKEDLMITCIHTNLLFRGILTFLDKYIILVSPGGLNKLDDRVFCKILVVRWESQI